MARKLTRKRRQGKVAKPYPDFPLTAHPTGRWCKKIKGKVHFFGRWGRKQGSRIVPVDNPAMAEKEAVDEYNRQRDDLQAGRTPRPKGVGDGLTVAELCNRFLTSKRNKLEAGELSARSFRDYFASCDRLVDHFGKGRRVDDLRPDDFEGFRKVLAERFGVVTLRNEINRCRVVFKYAHDQRLIDQPASYGQSFNRPSAKMLRRARNEAGQRMFESAEIRRILDGADPVLRAMILLGCNTGFGNSDVASLPQSAVDLDNGWIDFPRPKTEIRRRVPLWPETVEAMRMAINQRPKPADPADFDLYFLTGRGNRWVRMKESKRTPDNMAAVDVLSQKFAKLLKRLEINGRKGLGFYTLRHVFQTIAGESKDQVAVNHVMGHVDNSMSATYRERISDARLQAVVATVRAWLWPDGAGTGEGKG